MCPNRPVSLECTVHTTRFLRWRINSTELTCLGNADNGTVCLNSGNGAHAIITTVLPGLENLANITSFLVIDDIGVGVSVSCESQMTGVQEELQSASMWDDTNWCVCHKVFALLHAMLASFLKMEENVWYHPRQQFYLSVTLLHRPFDPSILLELHC